ncbi:TonB-dependent receptor domain-containing protein [Sphingoaurantiacus capsulatus]|uniref:TonB-dependent receptor domain-containing protein n=1 Tax=Sphingoaurantiacus capsulatus TaxID=1771310 RepID=A0ABV7XAM0_9SPHN
MSSNPGLKRALATTTATAALAFSFAGQALAQTATAEADTTAAEEEIVVTGSLIRNPNLEASSPVSVIGQDEIELQQANVAEELLRELPGAVPSIGSAVNNGNNGASYVDLRGLGTNRNVVLLDGQRIAPSNFVGRVDLNNIPLALIQRTEVLTGGASTTYGADAISGVVNFITRKDFAGAELNVSEQITEEGDGNRFRADLTLGANFDDGRGNAVFSVGYQETDPVYQGQRSISFLNVDSKNGQVGGGSTTAVPSAFSFARAGIAAGTAAPAGVLGGTRQVDPALGGAVRTDGANSVYAPFNFNPANIFQTPFERFNMFGQANYEIADGIEIFTRGLFSKNTVNTIIAASGVFNSSVTIPVSNPFLSPALRAQFCASNDFQHGGANGSGSFAGTVGNLATAGVQTLTPAECAAAALATSPTDPNYRTFTTNLSRRTTEAGPRVSDYRTTVFDYQVGVRGDLSESMGFEVSGAYGESENLQTLQGYIMTSRTRQALLATSTTACLNTANGCVPANFFGPEGSLSPAAIGFLNAEATTLNRTSLAQVRGTVSGDFGVSLPWADENVGFAVGAEYRNYTAQQKADTLSQTPGELGGAGGAAPNIDGGYNVKEVFGELIAPLVEGKPFFESLSLEAGIRHSKYEVQAAGNPSYDATTYKAGVQWEPGAGVKFRGQYSRAVRAPNIGELFTPVSTGLTALTTDPCAGSAPTTNAELRAICLAQGAPAFTIGSITPPTSSQANRTTGGNLNLKPEKADTYTIGMVYQPEFVPGLNLAIDWFDIKVNEAVSVPTPGDAIAACFGTNPASPPAGASTSAACTSIGRDPNTGNLNGNPANTPGLFLARSNLGTFVSRGIDLSANYTRDLSFARLALGFVGTYTKDSQFQAIPTSLNRECVGYYSPNCGVSSGQIQPKYQFSQRTTLGFGDVDVSLLWRFLDAVKYEPRQHADDLAAARANPTGCPDPAGADTGGCVVNPEFREIDAYHYFDLSTRWGITENISLTFSVENLFDKKPPLVGALVGTSAGNSGNTYPSTYDALGRKFAASARIRF